MIKLISRIIVFYKVYTVAKVPITYLFRKGKSLSSLKILYGVKRLFNDFNIIIDVGANQGQFSIASSFFFPKAKIFAFEPSKRVFSQLIENTKYIPNISTFQLALGDKVGTVSFYENEYSLVNSALEMSNYQKEQIPEYSKTTITEIEVNTLDNIFKSNIIKMPQDKILLKLDVQGYEKTVLDGAINSLNQIDYLLFETSFTELYKGELLFPEMHSFLSSKGFELIQPLSFYEADNFEILEMDVIYKRT